MQRMQKLETEFKRVGVGVSLTTVLSVPQSCFLTRHLMLFVKVSNEQWIYELMDMLSPLKGFQGHELTGKARE